MKPEDTDEAKTIPEPDAVTTVTAEPGTQPTGEVAGMIPKRRSRLRLLLLAALVLLLLAGTGLTIWQVREIRRADSARAQTEMAQTYAQVTDDVRQLDDAWNYDEEARVIEEYLATKPDSQYYNKLVMKLADAYLKDKKFDLAIGRYQELVDDPEYQLAAQRGLGKAYLGKGDLAQARKYFEQVVATMKTKTDPESVFMLPTDEAQLAAVVEQQ